VRLSAAFGQYHEQDVALIENLETVIVARVHHRSERRFALLSVNDLVEVVAWQPIVLAFLPDIGG
jgi:hypothetical protein